MKERLHYIDLAKGILILMVAYGHIGYQLCHNDGFDNIYMEKLSEISNVWVAFFMPAFFVVTGMCSNFCKQWKPFVVSQFKSLIVPAFTLALIVNILGVLLADKEFYLGVKVFLKGNSYWFLFSLFVAKMVYYKLNKYVRSLKHIVMSTLVLYLIFVLINNFLPQIPNYWCWIHALGLVPFLALGQVLRKYDVLNRRRVLFLSGGAYLILLIIYLLFDIKIPRITGGIYVPVVQMIPCLILSATGAIALLKLCMKIGSISWLECLGKHSLVIYCIHEGLIAIISPWLENNIVQASCGQAFVYYTMIWIYIVTVSWLISLLLNKKPFNILLGKF